MQYVPTYLHTTFQMIPGTKFEEELLAHQLDSFEARMKLMDIIILTKSEKKAR